MAPSGPQWQHANEERPAVWGRELSEGPWALSLQWPARLFFFLSVEAHESRLSSQKLLSGCKQLDQSNNQPFSAHRPFSQSKNWENVSQGLSFRISWIPIFTLPWRWQGRREREEKGHALPRKQLHWQRVLVLTPHLHSTIHTPESPKPPKPGNCLEAQTQAYMWAGVATER